MNNTVDKSTQRDLLGDPMPTRAWARSQRAALEAGRQRGEVGITRAADRTEQDTAGWCEQACEKVRMFANAQGGLFTIEHARFAVGKDLPPPHDLRSWGQVTRMCKARGFIEQTKTRFPAASSNGSEKPTYRKGPKA